MFLDYSFTHFSKKKSQIIFVTLINYKFKVIIFFKILKKIFVSKIINNELMNIEHLPKKPSRNTKKCINTDIKFPIFEQISIETINKCNNDCTFCPASIKTDTRPFKKMDLNLFNKIITELEILQYTGMLCLSLNNEPFLDDKIISLAQIARRALPKAYIFIWTNGTIINLEKFQDIMQYLDYIYIDNYNNTLKLIQPIKEIYYYCYKNKVNYKNKVKIYMRKKIKYFHQGQVNQKISKLANLQFIHA